MQDVLLVEDAENWQREITRSLEKAGYRVSLARSPLEVIEAFVKVGCFPSLVVMDMSLSQENPRDRQGLEIMKRISKDVPVLCVSGYLDEDEVDYIRDNQLALDVFSKAPFDEQRFLLAVKKSLSQEGYLYPRQKEEEAHGERAYAVTRAMLSARRIVVFGQILAVSCALGAVGTYILASSKLIILGHGSGFFAGMTVVLIAFSLECLCGLILLSRFYRLSPLKEACIGDAATQKDHREPGSKHFIQEAI